MGWAGFRDVAIAATCVLALLGGLGPSAGCVDGSSPRAGLATTEQAIIGGSIAKPDQFPAIVALYDKGDSSICTGTLIAPDAILTAAHCVSFRGDATEKARLIADTSVFIDTTSMYEPVTTLRVADVVVHPDYVRLADDPDKNGFHDVALIRLAAPITDRRVARVERAGLAKASNLAYTLVGYGIYDATTGSTGKLNAVTDTSVDCADYNTPGDRFICFDRTDGSGACAGDSGSPAFRATDSYIHALVGVHSWGSGGEVCGGIGADTKIAGELPFLIDTLGEAFVCAADGVCEEACDDRDIDCSALPEAACQGDNQCGEYYGCESASGTCQPLLALSNPDPAASAEAQSGGGCSTTAAAAANAPLGATLSLTALVGLVGLALSYRRRRTYDRQAP